MDVYLTLDYELFLGNKSGTIDKCLRYPLERMTEVVDEYGAKFTLFVDVTYLLKLKELKHLHPELEKDWQNVTNHLQMLSQNGHSLQLHIHPQWVYSTYGGNGWVIDNEHYKLSDISYEQAQTLFTDGIAMIKQISGTVPVAFRAGGFSAQPTSMLTGLLRSGNIKYDSSVYPHNKYVSAQQEYDYRNAPEGRIYKFSDDICIPDEGGEFLELPLSTAEYSPFFYWKLVFNRITKNPQHTRIGDGISVKTTGKSIMARLIQPSMGFATLDESKIDYLLPAYRRAQKRGDDTFCVIGHPKLATEYSLTQLAKCIKKMRNFKTL